MPFSMHAILPTHLDPSPRRGACETTALSPSRGICGHCGRYSGVDGRATVENSRKHAEIVEDDGLGTEGRKKRIRNWKFLAGDDGQTDYTGSGKGHHVVDEVLRDFASGTSLNGIPRIINARSLSARVFWSIICVGAFCMFLWTSSNLLHQYASCPKKVNVEIVQRPVTFPSVTVCNTGHLDVMVVERLERFFDHPFSSSASSSSPSFPSSSFSPSSSKSTAGGGAGSPVEQNKMVNHSDDNQTLIEEFLKKYSTFSEHSIFFMQYKEMRKAAAAEAAEGKGEEDGVHDGKQEEEEGGVGRDGTALKLDRDSIEITSRLGLAANVGPVLASAAGIQANTFIVSCRFMGGSCSISSKTFVKVFDPYYFNCFTFQPQVILQSRATRLSGVEYGLSLLLFSGIAGELKAANSGTEAGGGTRDLIPGMQEADATLASGQGARVVVHAPDTMAHPTADGYDIPSGFSVTLGVKARENERIPPPYGNCSKIKINNTAYSYSLISCQNACIQRAIMKTCQCIDNRIPLTPSRPADADQWERGTWGSGGGGKEGGGGGVKGDLPFCLQLPDLRISCPVSGEGIDMTSSSSSHPNCAKIIDEFTRTLECRKSVYDNMTIGNPDAMEQCKCFPPCSDVMYDVSYSLSMLPESTEEHAAFYAVILEFLEKLDPHKRSLSLGKEYAYEHMNHSALDSTMHEGHLNLVKSHISRVNVHIADSNIIKTTESPDYDVIRLVSDIGGQLGLWIGISVITLVEVLQLFVDVLRAVVACGRLIGGRGRTIAQGTGAGGGGILQQEGRTSKRQWRGGVGGINSTEMAPSWAMTRLSPTGGARDSVDLIEYGWAAAAVAVDEERKTWRRERSGEREWEAGKREGRESWRRGGEEEECGGNHYRLNERRHLFVTSQNVTAVMSSHHSSVAMSPEDGHQPGAYDGAITRGEGGGWDRAWGGEDDLKGDVGFRRETFEPLCGEQHATGRPNHEVETDQRRDLCVKQQPMRNDYPYQVANHSSLDSSCAANQSSRERQASCNGVMTTTRIGNDVIFRIFEIDKMTTV